MCDFRLWQADSKAACTASGGPSTSAGSLTDQVKIDGLARPDGQRLAGLGAQGNDHLVMLPLRHLFQRLAGLAGNINALLRHELNGARIHRLRGLPRRC